MVFYGVHSKKRIAGRLEENGFKSTWEVSVRPLWSVLIFAVPVES
jgi:hypothetical protein